MIAEELQIGDYIQNPLGLVGQVQSIKYMPKDHGDEYGDYYLVTLAFGESDQTFNINDAQPIPLTPEILEKNTSESNKNVFGGMNYALNADYFIENRGDRFCFSRRMAGHKYSTFWVCDIHYVHDLQHLIKLVGIDKKIQI